MTTTTITSNAKIHSLSALLHDAFHVRARVTQGEDAAPARNAAGSQRRKQSHDDQTTMLVTFAGRYGARF